MYAVEKAIYVREEQLAQIASGDKTTVRRALLPTQYIAEPTVWTKRMDLIQAIGEKHKGIVYQVGNIYPLVISGKPPIQTPHTVRLLDIERQPVALITDAEAKAEGWGGRTSFLLAWGANNPMEITECWVLAFELVDGSN